MSSFVSVIPKQNVVATPWFQRNYSSNIPSLEEEIEQKISQDVSDNDIIRVPSSNAVHDFVISQLNLNQGHINSMVVAYLNSLNYVYESTEESALFTINHNLSSNFIRYTLFIKNGSNYELTTNFTLTELNINTVNITLPQSKNIKLICSKIV